MSLPTPAELGRVMGLSPDGVAVTSHPRPVDELYQEWTGLMVRVSRSLVNRDPVQCVELHSFQEKFNSLYFLSLVKSAVQGGSPDLARLYLKVAAWTFGQGRLHVCRFFREQPELAIAYFYACARQLVARFHELRGLNPRNNKSYVFEIQKEVGRQLGTLFNCIRVLHSQLRPRVPFRPVPSDLVSGLYTVIHAYQTDKALIKTWNTYIQEPLNDHLRAVAGVLVQTSAEDLSDLRRGVQGPRAPWWGCQVQVIGERVVDVTTPCRTLDDGEQMKACGRCGAVRYCSKEHQHAHWKQHKAVCFRPTW